MNLDKAAKSVDIVVPVHNPGSYFQDTMRSVMSQDYPNFRVIVVNDGSTKGLGLIERYRTESRVLLIDRKANRGGGAARNVGLSHSTAEYVAFCDSDDIWPVDKLARQISMMDEQDFGISHTDIVRIGQADPVLVPTPERIDLGVFLRGTNLFCSTACVRGEIARSHEFGEMRKRHPFRYWVNILQSGHVSHRIDGVAVQYMHREGSVSSGKYSTLAYTALAYLIYPADKLHSAMCFLRRLRGAMAGNGRTLS